MKIKLVKWLANQFGFKAPVITTPITQYECALNDCCGEEGISRV